MMKQRFSRHQMMAHIRTDADFAEWYVESFMKANLPDYYFAISDEGKREMTLNGRDHARRFDIRDVPSQAHFITLMWKIGANFFTQPGFREVLADRSLSGPARIDRLYSVPREQAMYAIMNPDDRYWYPGMIAAKEERE